VTHTDSQSSSLRRSAVSVYADIVSPATLKTSLHLLLNLAIGIPSFALMVALVTTTAGLLIVFPLAVLTGGLLLFVTRAGGAVERLRYRWLLGVEIVNPHPRQVEGGILHQLRVWFSSGAAWREILYMVLLLPLGILTFTVAVVLWALPVALIGAPIEAAIFGDAPGGYYWALLTTGALVGVALLAFIPIAIRALGQLSGAMGKALLGPSSTEVLEERVSHLASSRTLVADTAQEERRRIERDLHDGAQQRLVALAIDLGMAKEKLDSDLEGARALVEEAHSETKRAIAELRDLAQGIHPAALTERGLEAALTPLAARSSVPTSLSVEVSDRPEPRVESVAYFVVAEALTNVAKHSGASRARVAVARHGSRLVVEVTDDGIGGADPDGGGLTGLRNRVDGVDGWFSVTSPPGGPTTIIAELPCETVEST
jgi:signal transduction histidine kinase